MRHAFANVPWSCLTLMLAVSCSTNGNIRSVKDESYSGRLERVLVVYQGKAGDRSGDTTATLGRDFPRRLAEHLADSLSKQSVPSEAVGFEESAIDRSGLVKAAAARFNPKQLLYVSVPQISSSSAVQWADPNALPHYSHNVVITLEFEVLDAGSDKTVWRGSKNFYSAPHVESVADQILSELHRASLL